MKYKRQITTAEGRKGIVVQHLFGEHHDPEPVSPDKVLIQTAHFADCFSISHKNLSLLFRMDKISDVDKLIDELVNSFNFASVDEDIETR